VRVLEDPQEIPLAQTFTVASEKLSRRSPDLACSHGTVVANGAPNEVESVLARKP
jgi:hypothetical protein